MSRDVYFPASRDISTTATTTSINWEYSEFCGLSLRELTADLELWIQLAGAGHYVRHYTIPTGHLYPQRWVYGRI